MYQQKFILELKVQDLQALKLSGPVALEGEQVTLVCIAAKKIYTGHA
jgi:hypothetical protein